MKRNYGLHGFNGLSLPKFVGASAELVRILFGGNLSVPIGCLYLNNFRKEIRDIRQIRS